MVILLFFTVLVGIEIFFNIPKPVLRISMYFVVISSTLGLFFSLIKIAGKAPLSVRTINDEIQKSYANVEDRLVNTKSLWKSKDSFDSPVAEEIIEKLPEETLHILKKAPGNILSLKIFYKKLIIIFIVILLWTAGFYFKPVEISDSIAEITESLYYLYGYYINVLPGDALIEKEGDLNVRVITNSKSVPDIEIERLEQVYREHFFESDENNYEFIIEDIREDLRYRCLGNSGRLKSRWYSVGIKPLPVVENIRLKYMYPMYTGLPDKVSVERQIECIRGTTVILDVESSNAIEKAIIQTDNDRIEMNIIGENKASGKLILEDQSFYQIYLEDTSGMVNKNSPLYKIQILKDESPEVEIYEPVEDIDISPDASIKISGNATDDIGLSKVYIAYHIDMAGSTKLIPIKELIDPDKSYRFSYVWDISGTDAVPGNIITYNIVVEDNDTLYGPGKGYSEELRLEIKGFRDKHKKILEDEKAFEESLFEMLSDSYEITSSMEENDFKGSLEKIDSINDKVKVALEKLKKLIEDMESDPYMDKLTINEYKGLKADMDYISRKNVPDLKAAAEGFDKKAVSKSRELSRQLERMARLSDDIAEREKMNDVLNSASDSLDKARDLSDILNSDSINPKDIQKKLEKIAHLLDELKKAMMDMPQELPEEFVNEESIKKLDFNAAPEMLSELRKALRSGDYETAKKILDKMINSMQAMMDKLQEAAGESHSSRREKLFKRTNEMADKLKFIIEKEKELITETEDINDIISAERNTYSRNRFKELKSKYRVLKSTVRFSLSKIDNEFKKGYLYNTQEILNDHKKKLKNEWKLERINEFLQELKYSPDDKGFLEDKQREELELMAEKQASLKNELSNVKEGFSTLGHLTAMIDMELFENIDLAGTYMGYAESSLSDHTVSEALPSERQALSYLIQIQNELNKFSAKMNSIPEKIGSGAPKLQYQYRPSISKGAGGRTGLSEGRVEIPKPGEARDGEEFRKMILEALKEKHPEEYKKLIEEYFKSLGE